MLETEQDTRSITHVLRSITDNVEVLVESRVELAKAELREAVRDGKAAAVPLGIGIAMVQLALGALLVAVISALATRYPLWLSALVVGAVTAIAAFVMIAQGKRHLTLVGQSSSAKALQRAGGRHG